MSKSKTTTDKKTKLAPEVKKPKGKLVNNTPVNIYQLAIFGLGE